MSLDVMIHALLPWLAATFSLLWAYPWARGLLARSGPPDGPRAADPVLTLLLTVGLSLGGLTWLLMLLAAISPQLATFWPVTILAAGLSAAGWVAWVHKRGHLAPAVRSAETTTPAPAPAPWWRDPAMLTAALIVLALAALTLFNAAYWPFYEDDTMTLYGPIAYRFATTGRFGGAGLYDAYPVLAPLAMAYPHLAAGAPDEYAARLVMAALAVGTIGAAYVLGRDLYGPPTGLAAAFLTATVPILPHWAASGYTDLPAGTFYALTAVFAWRAWTRPCAVNAALTGLLAGLAAFTKNGALLLVGPLAGWAAYSYWAARRDPGGGFQPISRRDILLMMGGWLIVAGPWYAHTLAAFGVLVPPTGWTEQADHALATLFGPALTPSHFLVSGPLAFLGLALLAGALWRSRPAFDPRPVLLLGFGVPFWLVWWWFFSYDLRFLLLVWPIFAVMGGYAVRWLAARLPPQAGPRGRAGWLRRGLLPLLLIALALPAAQKAVDHKWDILRDPFMDGDARHRRQLGGRWDVILWLRANVPPETSIIYNDYHFTYHLLQSHPQAVFWGTTDREDVRSFAYWVLKPETPLPAWAAAESIPAVYEAGGYTVYALPPPGSESD